MVKVRLFCYEILSSWYFTLPAYYRYNSEVFHTIKASKGTINLGVLGILRYSLLYLWFMNVYVYEYTHTHVS